MTTESRRKKLFFLSLALLPAALLPSAATAGEVVAFSKVFGPSTIGPGSVSTATFTIQNFTGAPVVDMAFVDVLPVAITIADPANASTDCTLDTGGSLTAPDGGSTIALSDAEVGAGASCTVTVDVTASTPGAHTNPAVTLTSSVGSTMSLPVDLTVDTNRPGFSKSFAPAAVPLGARSTLTFTIDNSAGSSSLFFPSFTDVFPAGLVVADPAAASTDCAASVLTAAPGATSVALSGTGPVAAGTTCTAVVDVVATAGGELDNVTSELLVSPGGTGQISAGKASDTLDVSVSQIALQKEFTDDPAAPGSTAALEFTVTNFDRLATATGIAFSDDLTTLAPPLPGAVFGTVLSENCSTPVSGAGTAVLSLSGATLSPEASCTVEVEVVVPPTATPGSYLNTSSTITATIGGEGVVGNAASDLLFVQATPVITKTFLDDPVQPGDTTELEFTITNTSATSAATDVAFEDIFDVILPTASVTPGDDCCGDGSTCTFTPLINPPPPSSSIPAQFTLAGGSLAPAGSAGDSCTFSITLDVVANAASGVYPNTTSAVTATVDGASTAGSPASDDLVVVAAPDLTKAFTDDPVPPGGTVTLEFTLTHPEDATTDATNIAFTDDLTFLAGLTANLPGTPDPPCGAGSTLTGSAGDTLLTFAGGTLAPGASCAFSVTLDVPAGAAPGGYTNTTSGVSADVDGVAATSAPATADLAVAGLTFAKEFLDNPVLPGQTVTLRFTIENVHPTDAATAIGFSDALSDVLPGTPDLTTSAPTVNTCNGTEAGTSTTIFYTNGSLAAGQTCTIEYPILVPVGAADGDYANTTSLLTATQSGGTVIIDAATDVLTIDSNLLQLSKAFTDDPVAPGDSVTLEFVLTNLDPSNAASAIAFTDDLAATLPGLTFSSLDFNDCGASVSGTGTGLITATGAALAAGGSCTIRVSLDVPAGADAGEYPNVTSAVTGTIGGFGVTGDPGSDTLAVLALLTFSKSFDGPTAATGTAVLTFTLTNPGDDAATGLAFQDDLSAVIPGLVATSLPVLPCGAASTLTGTSLLLFSGGELPPMGGTCSFDVEVQVPAGVAPGTYPNVTTNLTQGGLEVADPATADLTIEPPPTFAKEFVPNAIGTDEVSALTFTIDNSASAIDATDLAFVDNLPAGVVVATPPNATNSCTGGTLTAAAGTGVIDYSGGTVGAASSCTLVVDVTSSVVGTYLNTTGDLTSSSGNSGTASDTLDVFDATPPQIVLVDTINGTGDGELEFCETAYTTIDALLATFDEPMFESGTADPNSVTNPANWQVVAAGKDLDLSTVDCSGVGGDDVDQALVEVTYDGGTLTAAVLLEETLENAPHLFLACSGGLADTSLNALDGDGDGAGGDDFALYFRVDEPDRFVNGHFDCDLEGWTAVTEGITSIDHDPAVDVDGASISGSARFTGGGGTAPLALGQCASVVRGSVVSYRGSALLDTTGTTVELTRTCDYYTSLDCSGTPTPGQSVTDQLSTPGVWFAFSKTEDVPSGARSALCEVSLSQPSGATFEVFVDDLSLDLSPGKLIFMDGFESGDLMNWSNVVP